MCFFLVSVTCLLWSVPFPRSLSLVLLTSSRSIFVFLNTVKAVKVCKCFEFWQWQPMSKFKAFAYLTAFTVWRVFEGHEKEKGADKQVAKRRPLEWAALSVPRHTNWNHLEMVDVLCWRSVVFLHVRLHTRGCLLLHVRVTVLSCNKGMPAIYFVFVWPCTELGHLSLVLR